MKLHKTLTAVVVASTLTVCAPLFAQQAADAAHAAPAYTAKAPKLNKSQIDQLLQHPENLVIVDLRRPDELQKIGGFPVYLSIQAKDLEKSLAFIPKDRKIVTVSNHAGRAGKGADLLVSKGYQVVGAIGVQDFEAEGGTLTRIQPPAKKPTDGQAPKQAGAGH